MSPMKLFSQGMLGKLGAKDETRKRYFSDETLTDSELGNKGIERAGVGGAIGVTAGAILKAVAAIGTSAATGAGAELLRASFIGANR
jgi:hypothetical protein